MNAAQYAEIEGKEARKAAYHKKKKPKIRAKNKRAKASRKANR